MKSKAAALRCTVLKSAIVMGLCMWAGMAASQTTTRPWNDNTLSPDARAKLLLAQLTQDEKFQLIRSYYAGPDRPATAPFPKGAIASAGYVPPIERLGIPALEESDAGLGVASSDRMRPGDHATPLPAGPVTAASWDPQVAYRGGAMIGSEAHSKGFNVLLAGGINLTREPRNGRNFEYAGEDPLLAATIVGQAIRGIQDQHVISTIKHYALNDQETGRNTISAQIGEQAMRESDLLAFELAIEIGKPGSVMCSYNKINGDWACENDYLMNQVLKRDWKYPGFVMSDWGGVHSAAKSVNAGLDQESAGEVFDKEVYFDAPLRAALAKGEVKQARLDDMVQRILRSMFAAGLFQYPAGKAPIDSQANLKVARETLEDGAVLLRNENALLPLDVNKLQSIAVIGAHADKGVLAGGGSSLVTAMGGNAVPGIAPTTWPGPVMYHPYAPLKALRDAAPKASVQYAEGNDVAAAAALAAKSQVAVVFVQKWQAESIDTADLSLPDNQDALVEAVAKANPHTIVVLENSGPVAMPWLERVGAVLETWYPGGDGGKAIANLLSGKVNPSGRLPVSWPGDLSQLPRRDIPGVTGGTPPETVDYAIEGANVGYRWYQAKGIKPLFPFGFGLSYTQFKHGDLKVDAKGTQLQATVDVTNTGSRAGADVAQVYVHVPGAKSARLAGYAKVFLKPGEHRTLTIPLEPRLLADFDAGKHEWVIRGGQYSVSEGPSSADLGAPVNVQLPTARP
ncbi:beta-glucosidase family protein [Dyella kyungheensis]|uniref:Glycoside hydrolase family 3 C-terminal domain-containing protein n=1 Tax=Dyella kyungheensis TaxID=1242174 RepID=A0ABS2JYQ9_9GAMM|nr:glycoside hydrolase family 3 C-terminal domain-containing protein [Dyella kyungheensis]MBM7123643.1 glycoside hydrolase family 3 C-terminal domain-containing protein [Dyella kyungheensis]